MSTNDKYTKETDKRFTLRIDKNLFEATKESARQNRRAIGKEMEFALFQYYKQELKN